MPADYEVVPFFKVRNSNYHTPDVEFSTEEAASKFAATANKIAKLAADEAARKVAE